MDPAEIAALDTVTLARRLDYAEYMVMRARDAGNLDSQGEALWLAAFAQLHRAGAARGLDRGAEGYFYARNAELHSGVCDW